MKSRPERQGEADVTSSTKDAEDKTEIIYEPWHWRYVGVENAAKINASGLCFEDYIETLQSIAAEG